MLRMETQSELLGFWRCSRIRRVNVTSNSSEVHVLAKCGLGLLHTAVNTKE